MYESARFIILYKNLKLALIEPTTGQACHVTPQDFRIDQSDCDIDLRFGADSVHH